MQERLQKYMAGCGVASRRKCEEIILSGRVKVNNVVVKELGVKVDGDVDKVTVNGNLISTEERKVYIALNKPTAIISSVKDEKGRDTIIDLVPIKERIYPIGRLDSDSSGLILLTNDGDIYNKLMHPSEEINKVYVARLTGTPDEENLEKFRTGVNLGDYITSHAEIEILSSGSATSRARITIHEGKNRQIRRMCEGIGHPVLDLCRISVGNINLGELKLGAYRHLTEGEVEYLKSL